MSRTESRPGQQHPALRERKNRTWRRSSPDTKDRTALESGGLDFEVDDQHVGGENVKINRCDYDHQLRRSF